MTAPVLPQSFDIDVCAKAELTMWRVIVHRAWSDATGEGMAGESGRKGVPRNPRHVVRVSKAVREAQAWFGSADFFDVCELAQLDGHAVLERYRLRRRVA